MLRFLSAPFAFLVLALVLVWVALLLAVDVMVSVLANVLLSFAAFFVDFSVVSILSALCADEMDLDFQLLPMKPKLSKQASNKSQNQAAAGATPECVSLSPLYFGSFHILSSHFGSFHVLHILSSHLAIPHIPFALPLASSQSSRSVEQAAQQSEEHGATDQLESVHSCRALANRCS